MRGTEPGEFPVANQTPRELSIYLSSLQAKIMPGLSSLELEDVQIPGIYLLLLYACFFYRSTKSSTFHSGFGSVGWRENTWYLGRFRCNRFGLSVWNRQ